VLLAGVALLVASAIAIATGLRGGDRRSGRPIAMTQPAPTPAAAAAVAGLTMNAHCGEPRRSVNAAYLLAMRAPAEFALRLGDWSGDLTRSNELLDACAAAARVSRHPRRQRLRDAAPAQRPRPAPDPACGDAPIAPALRSTC